jgi:hypothetical protein
MANAMNTRLNHFDGQAPLKRKIVPTRQILAPAAPQLHRSELR